MSEVANNLEQSATRLLGQFSGGKLVEVQFRSALIAALAELRRAYRAPEPGAAGHAYRLGRYAGAVRFECPCGTTGAWEAFKRDAYAAYLAHVAEARAEQPPAGDAAGHEPEPWVPEADALAREILAFVTADQRDDQAACRGKSVSGIVYAGAERIYRLGQAHVASAADHVAAEPDLRALLNAFYAKSSETRLANDGELLHYSSLKSLLSAIVDRLEADRSKR